MGIGSCSVCSEPLSVTEEFHCCAECESAVHRACRIEARDGVLVAYAGSQNLRNATQYGIAGGMPVIDGTLGVRVSVWDFVSLVAIGATLAFVFLRIVGRTSLFPVRDPRLIESINMKN